MSVNEAGFAGSLPLKATGAVYVALKICRNTVTHPDRNIRVECFDQLNKALVKERYIHVSLIRLLSSDELAFTEVRIVNIDKIVTGKTENIAQVGIEARFFLENGDPKLDGKLCKIEMH